MQAEINVTQLRSKLAKAKTLYESLKKNHIESRPLSYKDGQRKGFLLGKIVALTAILKEIHENRINP